MAANSTKTRPTHFRCCDVDWWQEIPDGQTVRSVCDICGRDVEPWATESRRFDWEQKRAEDEALWAQRMFEKHDNDYDAWYSEPEAGDH